MGKKYPHSRVSPNHYMREFDLVDDDVTDVKEFFKKIGYDINSDIPIWKQFHIKYNLPYEDE